MPGVATELLPGAVYPNVRETKERERPLLTSLKLLPLEMAAIKTYKLCY